MKPASHALLLLRYWLGALALCLPSAPCAEGGDAIRIVDTYGCHRVTSQQVLSVAGVSEGDPVPHTAAGIAKIVQKVQHIPGVRKAAVAVIYGSLPKVHESGYIVFIGIEEEHQPSLTFRPLPTAVMSMPAEIEKAYRDYRVSLEKSVSTGDSSEDDSEGHALIGNLEARRIQRGFVALADRHHKTLVGLLNNSGNVEHRTIAAIVLAYRSDKSCAGRDLLSGISDPSPQVRNEALRGIGIIVDYASSHHEIKLDLPTSLLIRLLDSLEWTDRNKATAVLLAVTKNDGHGLTVSTIPPSTLQTLSEMAQWKSTGHGRMAFCLLGRILQFSDADIECLWKRGTRNLTSER